MVRAVSAIQKRRTDLELKQHQIVAGTSGAITRDGLSRIENGRQWPSALQILALARYYRHFYPDLKPCDICREALEAWLSAHPEGAI